MERQQAATDVPGPPRRPEATVRPVPTRRQRVVAVAVLLAATVTASFSGTALGAFACLAAPERDERRDEWMQTSLGSVRLRNPRLVQPDAREWAVVPRPEASALESQRGETARFWVEQLVEGDDLTALARHDQLLAAGGVGFEALFEWLAVRVGMAAPPVRITERLIARPRPEPLHASAARQGEGLARVLSCVLALLQDARTRPWVAEGPARERLATVVAQLLQRDSEYRLTLESRPAALRTAYQVLAATYTAEQAAELAQGLALPDGATQAVVARALSEFAVDLPAAVLDEAWSNVPESVQRLMRVEESGTQLVLAGPYPFAEEEALVAASSEPAWHEAVAELRRRWLAAWPATPSLVRLLGHSLAASRSRAVEVLRRLTGAFERYRASADPLTRQRAAMRWAHRLFILERQLGLARE